MNKRIELPLVEPLYSTYHYQATATAIAVNNPTVKNLYFNEVMNLKCNRRFLRGFTTPNITVVYSSWVHSPLIEKHWMSAKFIDPYYNFIVKNMLDNGFYVAFEGIDDYYIEGKTWYNKRQFFHDGLICGYDQIDKSYCVYAYNSNWIYKKFWVPQKAFDLGRKAAYENGVFSCICGISAVDRVVQFSPQTVYDKLEEYLDSDFKKYPLDGEGDVYGIIVHAYISEYIMCLYSGEIPYEKMDRRIMRVIWEHKKVMLKRISMVEQTLKLENKFSEQYKSIVNESNKIRALYMAHHIKRRDSVLPVISRSLITIMDNERELLTEFIKEMKKELQKNAVGISEG